MLHMYPSLAYQRRQSFRCLQIVSEVDLFKNIYIFADCLWFPTRQIKYLFGCAPSERSIELPQVLHVHCTLPNTLEVETFR